MSCLGVFQPGTLNPEPLNLCIRIISLYFNHRPKGFRFCIAPRPQTMPRSNALDIGLVTLSDPQAFIRKYFNLDIGESVNYDLVINTDTVSVENSVEAIGSAAGLNPG